MTSHAWSCILSKYRNGTDQSSIHPARFDYSSKVTIPISHTQTKTSSRATITTGSSSKVSITDNFIKPIKFTKKAQRNQNQQLPLTVTWHISYRIVSHRHLTWLCLWSNNGGIALARPRYAFISTCWSIIAAAAAAAVPAPRNSSRKHLNAPPYPTRELRGVGDTFQFQMVPI